MLTPGFSFGNYKQVGISRTVVVLSWILLVDVLTLAVASTAAFRHLLSASTTLPASDEGEVDGVRCGMHRWDGG